jgi:hypothetical protein
MSTHITVHGREVHVADVADVVAALPALVRDRRTRMGLGLRAVEAQSGVPFNSISRYEREIEGLSTPHLLSLLRWVAGLPAEPVGTTDAPTGGGSDA